MTYDRYANRWSQSISSGCAPQQLLCPTSSLSFANPGGAQTNQVDGWCYDASGNLLAKIPSPCSPTFQYDAENRLVADYAAGSTYAYDGSGMRVQKTVGSSSTVFLWSGSRDVAEYDNGAAPSAPSREFIYAGGLPGSGLLASITPGTPPTTTYFHADHLDWRISTDANGNLAGQQGHYPFGESWYSSNANQYVFTSYQRDAESGNDYAQARYNVNRLGRFSSLDPLPGSTSDPQSLNRYSYVRNMPVTAIDPTGMWPCVATNVPDDGENKGVDTSRKYFGPDAEPEPLGTICLDGTEIDLSGGGGDGQGGGGLSGLVTADSLGSAWSSGEPFGFVVLPTSWGYVFLANQGGAEYGDWWVEAYYVGLPGGGGGAGSLPDCKTLSLNNPGTFWNDSYATEEQVQAFLESQPNAPGNWDGYNAADAFQRAGINPGLAVGIIGAETSFGNGPRLSQNNINNPFSAFPGGKPASNFAQSLSAGLGTVTNIQNHTSSDSTPFTALIDNQNDAFGNVPACYDCGGPQERHDWLNNVTSWFRNFAKFLGKCR